MKYQDAQTSLSHDPLVLASGKLYLLSGLPASGKTTWFNRLVADNPGILYANARISMDDLREQMLGGQVMQTAQGELQYFLHESSNNLCYEIAVRMIQARLNERLTTFFDATNLTESDRASLLNLATQAGVEGEVLIFDLPSEVCIASDRARARVVGRERIQQLDQKFARQSTHPHRIIDRDQPVVLIPNRLPHAKIDVIGDVHGLYDETLRLLDKLGYALERGVPAHGEDPERRLLFLGDFVDRGQQSIEMLRLMYAAAQAGHFVIQGNHERKLVRFIERLKAGDPKLVAPSSLSSAETCVAFMKLKPAEQNNLLAFLKALPGYYVLEPEAGPKVAFLHANLPYFDPATTLHSEMLYGSEFFKKQPDTNTDDLYHAGYPKRNRYLMVRGHIPHHEGERPEDYSVVSLEEKQAFAGNLIALRLDRFLDGMKAGLPVQPAAEAARVREASTFDFTVHSKRYALLRGMTSLVSRKLVVAATDPTYKMNLYKYSKRVFFDRLWSEDPLIAKARGLVLDPAGNVVVHPFDKVFNYQENGAGADLDESTKVVVVDKENGFLACVSQHPFESRLLLTTTGSFDSRFVGYIDALLTTDQRSAIHRFLRHEKVTLMFEAIHPEDPHIIAYPPSAHGLYLIGARGKRPTDQPLREDQLDAMANQLGFRRPAWRVTTFGEAKAFTRTAQNEGYMVREDSASQPFVVKMKSPFYLTTKFIARLSDDRIRQLYAHPKSLKQKVDEEFYPIVDRLPDTISLPAFLDLDKDARTRCVRALVEDLLGGEVASSRKPVFAR